MSFVLIVGFVLAIVAIIAVPIRLASTAPIPTETLSIMTSSLLWVAGFFSGLMTLGILAAALWGMDTRLPWGLGVYPYLIPALSLPAFLLLRFSSLTTCRGCFGFSLPPVPSLGISVIELTGLLLA